VPTFKTAYLIHGDDHGRIAERRATLRTLAESLSGPEGLQLLEGEAATPQAAAGALDALTLAVGRRFIIVDGVERWKDPDLDGLEAAVRHISPETTIAFFAREEGRAKAPDRLRAVVTAVRGDISAVGTLKPWELPRWVIAQAAELGIELAPDGARALVAHVGERQQRLLRELEKLALGGDGQSTGGDGQSTGADGQVTVLDAEQVTRLTASSAERRAWTVADALVAGDGQVAVRAFLELRQQGERVPGLIYWISQRVRQAHEVAAALDAGEAPAQIRRRLRLPSRAADRLIDDAGRAGVERLRRAICEIADLELASRGGGSRGAAEDTAALLALGRIAA
jgi:DNA polymerase-3 subunit delta